MIPISRLANSATNFSGSIAFSCGVAPRDRTSPRAIIWAMIDAGKAVVRIIALIPVAGSSLSTMS